jgi:hypothetical protein
MKVGDLVRIRKSDSRFNLRPGVGSIGMIVEIRPQLSLGRDFFYYVYIDNVGWRYDKSELELIDNGSG